MDIARMKLPHNWICAYKMRGDGIQAPGCIVMRHYPGAYHPFVIHFWNEQDNGYYNGNYCVTREEANRVFSAKVKRYDPTGTLHVDDLWKLHYRNCRVCGKQLDERTFADACRLHHKQACSSECRRAEWESQFRCCEKAEFLNCVCLAALKCPVHGTRHYGTHD